MRCVTVFVLALACDAASEPPTVDPAPPPPAAPARDAAPEPPIIAPTTAVTPEPEPPMPTPVVADPAKGSPEVTVVARIVALPDNMPPACGRRHFSILVEYEVVDVEVGEIAGDLIRSRSMLPDADALSADISALQPELVAIRHDLHEHPELGFEEHRTSALVRTWLERHGYAPRPCAATGLVADLRPDLIGHARTIGLRADLDCLPMPETTDLPYRSVHDGRAHKCGHDGHTAILLGVAAVLARHRDALPGNVRLLFQPAEEGVDGGGAKVMVAEGALDRVDEVYGLHNWPGYPYGHVRVKAGAMLAQTHWLGITIEGKGGHASQPQLCRDPIVAASHLVVALQTVIARGLGYEGGGVVSIARFSAGTTDNVLPGRAELEGTVRTFAPEVTARVLERIREIADGTAKTFGVRVQVELEPGYPVVMNDPRCAAAVRKVAERVVGPDRVSEAGVPMAGGEDFAYMVQATPGAYFFVGTGAAAGDTPICHHPDFDFDDRIIPTAMAMFLGLVRDRLEAV